MDEFEDNAWKARVAEFAAKSEAPICGPHGTAYGFGWSPTTTYWIGKRRIHLYCDILEEDDSYPFAIEIGDVSDKDNPIAQRCHISKVDQALDIMERFLCKNVPIEELSDYKWIVDECDKDKFILDPPNAPNPANFAGWTGGDVYPKPKKKPWWKFW